MSNEYKDWIMDQRTQLNINTRDLNNLPNGWTKSLIHALRSDLFYILGGFAEDFIVTQCKEKYGRMMIYWKWKERPYEVDELMCLNELYDSINSVINKYSELSYNTCVVCGKPAECYTTDWVLPFCYDCFNNGVC